MSSATLPANDGATPDRLMITLFIALVLHVILILGIHFSPADRARDSELPTMEITVVQKAATPTKDPEYLAAHSQDGAGNTEEKVRPQQESMAAAPPPAADPNPPAAAEQPVIAQLEAERPAAIPREEALAAPTLTASQMMENSLEMISLNREINQSLQAYAQRKKEKAISASTQEFKYANYMNDWVAKVERIGDLNYPDEARRRRISGSLRVNVSLNADGSVRDVTITKPSGYKLLDDAALRIVELAGPFAPFPQEIREETDILHITRTWEFTSGNRLQGR